MNARNFSLVLIFATVIANSAHGQGDFFWSFSDFNSGGINSKAVGEFEPGDSGSLYLYFTTNGPIDTDIDTGCFIDITTSMAGIVNFTDSVVFNPNVDDDTRWAGWSDGIISSDTQLIDEFGGFAFPGHDYPGSGMRDSTTSEDELYDADADAFLVGRVDFDVVGSPGSATEIDITGEIVHQDQQIFPVIGNAAISVAAEEVPGDVNCDGVLNHNDVAPFVNLISSGGYSTKADINQDGLVSLLDVALFVDLLVG